MSKQDGTKLLTRCRVERWSAEQTLEAKALVARRMSLAELSTVDDRTWDRLALQLLEREGQKLGLGEAEITEKFGNLLVYAGASNQWQTLIGNGTATGGQNLTYFNNANAHIGVGDSATGAAATQTDLQAATNKLRRAMEATYPQHTDATTSGAASIVFRSVFGSSDANWVWAEWGVFNASSGGRMLNRKVEANGTKGSGSIWTMTVTLTLA